MIKCTKSLLYYCILFSSPGTSVSPGGKMERAWPRNEMMPGHIEEFIKINEVNWLHLFY